MLPSGIMPGRRGVSMDNGWYYGRGNQQRGPMSLDDLREALVRDGDVAQAYVWRDGFTDWKRAPEVQELYPTKAPGPPPLPAPPASKQLGDTAANVAKLCFSFSGRITRTKFWIGQGILWGVIFAVLLLLIVAVPHPVSDNGNSAAVFLFFVIYLPCSWMHFAVAIKRFHDLDHSGLYVLFFLVPVVGLLLFLFLGFAKGDTGENRFGPEPS